MHPVITLDRRGGAMVTETGIDGVLRLPRRGERGQVHFTVLGHHGAEPVEVAEEATEIARLRTAAAALLGRWERAEVVLEPVLLAAARAFASGTTLSEAATRPVRIEPAPGVLVVPLRTPTLPPATHTNCVLVGAGAALALVEPASPYDDEVDRLVELANQLDAEGRKVAAIFATHHHGDHVGGAARLRERLGVPLLCHRETARRMAVPADRLLEDGEEAFGLRALFTPGHAPGHLCYLEPRTRTLVAGDMVAGEGTILVSPHDDGDMAAYLESLARLAALDLHVLVPAHGPPTARPRALLDHYLRHRRMREQRVLDALAPLREPARLDELVPRVYDDTPVAAWPLALLSLEAHLEKLAAEGRVRREGDGWRGVAPAPVPH